MFGAPALLDRYEGKMEIAIRLCGGLDQHGRYASISALECVE